MAKGRETQQRRREEIERAELDAQLAEDEAEYERQRAERAAAAQWARDLLARDGWRLLDTETTGLEEGTEIVQIAVVDPLGRILLDTLVRPSGPIPPEASEVHGITDEHVASTPSFPGIYAQLASLLAGRDVVAYNAAFDRSIVVCGNLWI